MASCMKCGRIKLRKHKKSKRFFCPRCGRLPKLVIMYDEMTRASNGKPYRILGR